MNLIFFSLLFLKFSIKN